MPAANIVLCRTDETLLAKRDELLAGLSREC